MKLKTLAVSLLLLVTGTSLLYAQERWQPTIDKLEHVKELLKREKKLRKAAGFEDRAEVLMNGNQITTRVFNYGSISKPGERIFDIRWKELGYAYEFGPMVAAEVVDANGDTIHIVSEGLIDNGDRSPDGSKVWGWNPLPGFHDPTYIVGGVPQIATNDAPDGNGDGKPDSWPENWYNDALQAYVWPGPYARGATTADKEALYVMDDRDNEEFSYYPFPDDSTRRGLGLEVLVRLFQWTSPLAEDAIFITYSILNRSPKVLEKVFFAMWGDPHVGGANDFSDDNSFFDILVDMVYAWDADNTAGAGFTGVPGYFGYKFLESPGNNDDGIDNDQDGLVDEDMNNGIDDDGDWNPETDDVGVDGVPDTGDEGEGDGLPTSGSRDDVTQPGEPNFEFTDLDEADQIGLTSFNAFLWSSQWPRDDLEIWRRVTPGNFSDIEQNSDSVFLYGSGPIRLDPIETQRFSVALLLGENKDDLFLNAEVVQTIYDSGYRFTRPPLKPIVTAVPGDGKVTLYWDSRAEESVDDITGKDFEGYVIYRSTDFQFLDITTITDANGSKFLARPLTDAIGNPARFDLINGIKGLATVPYPGRGVAYYLGDDTGLRHSYVDSTVKNGVTYYYAVVSYDHGDYPRGERAGIPPTESSKSITEEQGRLVFDVNTVAVTPNPPAIGFVPPEIVGEGVQHTAGPGTGTVRARILDVTRVEDGDRYVLTFSDTLVTDRGEVLAQKNYSVRDMMPVTETFFAKVGGFLPLNNQALIPGTVEVLDPTTGTLFAEGVDYEINYRRGKLKALPGGGLQDRVPYQIRYEYFPIYQSTYLNGEDGNPVFDGIQLFVEDEKEIRIDEEKTGWVRGGVREKGYELRVQLFQTGKPYPASYEIRFADENIDEDDFFRTPVPFTIWNLTENKRSRFVFLDKADKEGNRKTLSSGDAVVILNKETGTESSWMVTFADTTADTTGVIPKEGDVFLIHTTKPFRVGDVFELETKSAREDKQLAVSALDRIAVVPNPYVVSAEWEPRQVLVNVPRERRLQFINLPTECTIRIYTLAGELVDTIEHKSTVIDGAATWDLLSKDNVGVAYGVYIYHVEAPGIGEKIGKFAIIK
jgi:hypothetical protein